MIEIWILAIVGFILSLYSFYVEKRLEKNSSYSPTCDITQKVSCSVAFTSKYAKIFGINNSILGLIFYSAIILLSLTSFAWLILYFAASSVLITFYLAYISYFKLKNFCLVCSTIYLVNLLIFIFAWIRFA